MQVAETFAFDAPEELEDKQEQEEEEEEEEEEAPAPPAEAGGNRRNNNKRSKPTPATGAPADGGGGADGGAPVAQSLMGLARLDTCVTVVDCSSFSDNLTSIEELRDRCGGAPISGAAAARAWLAVAWNATAAWPHTRDARAWCGRRHADEVEEGDERNIAQLLIDQIEFADVVLLNKADLVGGWAGHADPSRPCALAPTSAEWRTHRAVGARWLSPLLRARVQVSRKQLAQVRASVRRLNPSARVLTTRNSRVDLKEVLHTGRFDMDKVKR